MRSIKKAGDSEGHDTIVIPQLMGLSELLQNQTNLLQARIKELEINVTNRVVEEIDKLHFKEEEYNN